MSQGNLIELLRVIDGESLEVWLDGGWGVDALIGHQSRTHADVDIVIRTSDVPRLIQFLSAQGFRVKNGEVPNSFVLADGNGLEVDVHSVVFDDAGNGTYRMQNGEDWVYPEEGFSGQGLVGDLQVKCLSPATQVLCHSEGYDPGDTDLHDMDLLRAKFGVELPPHLTRKPS